LGKDAVNEQHISFAGELTKDIPGRAAAAVGKRADEERQEGFRQPRQSGFASGFLRRRVGMSRADRVHKTWVAGRPADPLEPGGERQGPPAPRSASPA
jgi:hypothetical protein